MTEVLLMYCCKYGVNIFISQFEGTKNFNPNEHYSDKQSYILIVIDRRLDITHLSL